MPFVQRQISGEEWYPRTQDLNSLSRSANSIGKKGAQFTSAQRQNSITVTVYNASGMTLPAGCGVQTLADATNEPFAVSTVADITKFYGVLAQQLSPGQIGDMIVSGICSLSNEVYGQYATPQGTAWVASESGVQVISGAMALLGAGISGENTDLTNRIYNSGSGVVVSYGYFRLGGHRDTHSELTFNLRNTTLYAYAYILYENSEYPEFSIGTTAPASYKSIQLPLCSIDAYGKIDELYFNGGDISFDGVVCD